MRFNILEQRLSQQAVTPRIFASWDYRRALYESGLKVDEAGIPCRKVFLQQPVFAHK